MIRELKEKVMRKVANHRELATEIKSWWKLKVVEGLSFVIGALALLQKAVLLGSARILTRVLGV